MSEIGNDRLTVQLPDGSTLIAVVRANEDYPGIDILLSRADGTEEKVCFVEHDSGNQEDKQLCIGVYNSTDDAPVFYQSYQNS